jgi:hypothetical protein
MKAIRTAVIAGVIAAAVTAAPPVAAQPVASCPDGDIIVDAPSTSYWICLNGSYVWMRAGSDPDSGMGVGDRPGRPGPNPTD